MDLQAAAAVPLAGLTALQVLRDHVRAGVRVAVLGASGGVGSHALQVAGALGAEVVAVTSTPAVEVVANLPGVSKVVDRLAQPLAEVGEVDVLLDASGKVPARRLVGLVRRGGLIATVNPLKATRSRSC